MNAEDAVRFLAHEAQLCRDRDMHEALCLNLPALMKALQLPPMGDTEARSFRSEFKATLTTDFRFDREPSRVGCGGMT